MERREFAVAMAVMTAAIGKTMPQPQADAYFSLLCDIPADVFKAAVSTVLCEHAISTLPTIAELRKVAAEIQRSDVDSLDPAEAFRLARKAVRCYGWPEREAGLKSLPPLVARAVEQIGWDAFCESENPEALRAHFFKAFEQTKAGKVRRENLPPVVQGQISDIRRIIAERPMKGINS